MDCLSDKTRYLNISASTLLHYFLTFIDEAINPDNNLQIMKIIISFSPKIHSQKGDKHKKIKFEVNLTQTNI